VDQTNIVFVCRVSVRDQISELRPSFIVGRHDAIVRLVAGDIRKPYLVTWQSSTSIADDSEPASAATETDEFVFRMIPSGDDMATLVSDVISRMRWEDVAILYSDRRGEQRGVHFLVILHLFVIARRVWFSALFAVGRELHAQWLYAHHYTTAHSEIRLYVGANKVFCDSLWSW